MVLYFINFCTENTTRKIIYHQSGNTTQADYEQAVKMSDDVSVHDEDCLMESEDH